MNDEIYPRHYEAWRKCITEKCKITLTKEYVAERIEALSAENSSERKIFIDKYGAHWHKTVLKYFHECLLDFDR